jgi:hypothetical protein
MQPSQRRLPPRADTRGHSAESASRPAAAAGVCSTPEPPAP